MLQWLNHCIATTSWPKSPCIWVWWITTERAIHQKLPPILRWIPPWCQPKQLVRWWISNTSLIYGLYSYEFPLLILPSFFPLLRSMSSSACIDTRLQWLQHVEVWQISRMCHEITLSWWVNLFAWAPDSHIMWIVHVSVTSTWITSLIISIVTQCLDREGWTNPYIGT